MARGIVRATRLNGQLQMALMEYGDETKLKLRQSSGCDFIRGLKRERLEIMAEILCYCNQQKTKTDIMYKVNLNHAQLKRYLRYLTSQGLLMVNKNKYAATQKGCRFLDLFVQLNDILGS